MTVTESDIRSIPTILRQTIGRLDEQAGTLAPILQGPLAVLGCGSSHCLAVAAAALYEGAHATPAQAIMASEYRPRPGWTHVAVSRTGQTSELVAAMRAARAVGAHVLLVRGETGSPAEAQADAVLPLEFAPEEGVIQTRFIIAAALALRLLIGGPDARRALGDLPDRVEQGLQAFDPGALAQLGHVVFLGRDWRYGVALAAALTVQETALVAPEAHQTMEYRHGPIASAEAGTLVWCFDPPDDPMSAAVLDDVRRTGATVRCTEDDPLVALAQAQLLAVRLAEARGVNPDRPRHLSRAIVLPES